MRMGGYEDVRHLIFIGVGVIGVGIGIIGVRIRVESRRLVEDRRCW